MCEVGRGNVTTRCAAENTPCRVEGESKTAPFRRTRGRGTKGWTARRNCRRIANVELEGGVWTTNHPRSGRSTKQTRK